MINSEITEFLSFQQKSELIQETKSPMPLLSDLEIRMVVGEMDEEAEMTWFITLKHCSDQTHSPQFSSAWYPLSATS